MTNLSTRDAFGECLVEIGKDERIVVLDSDLSKSTKTIKFSSNYPTRFFNVGCAEQNLIATAAGFAYAGKIVIASSYAIFVTSRAWEQIRSIVAHDDLNMKIIVTHAGLTNAADGATHHSLEDITLMRVIPNMTVIVPADAEEAIQAIKAAIKHNGPCYIRLSRAKTPVLFNSNYKFKIGKCAVLKNGYDLTIMASGNMVCKALEAADKLSLEGITARVLNISTIKPLDNETIILAGKETGCVVVAEEHSVLGGLGSAVSEVLSNNFPVPIEFIGVKDKFGQSGNLEDLYDLYELTSKNIIVAAKKVLSKKKIK